MKHKENQKSISRDLAKGSNIVSLTNKINSDIRSLKTEINSSEELKSNPRIFQNIKKAVDKAEENIGNINGELFYFMNRASLVETNNTPLIAAELLETLKQLRSEQGQDGNWNYNPYMQGMYNGIELILSVIEDKEPEFKEAPAAWLSDSKPTEVLEASVHERTKENTKLFKK